MRQILAAAAVLAAMAGGCSAIRDRTREFPQSDVVEPPGLKLREARGVRTSGGTLQSGTLEYAGEADLRKLFRTYVNKMQSQGWASTYSDVTDDRATGTLRKDDRILSVDFLSVDEAVRGTIRVDSINGAGEKTSAPEDETEQPADDE